MQTTLNEFERLAFNGPVSTALDVLMDILGLMDQHGGSLSKLPCDGLVLPRQQRPAEVEEVLADRLRQAMTTLVLRPDFALDDLQFRKLMQRHRWICSTFASGRQRHADSLIRLLGASTGELHQALDIHSPKLKEACLLYSLESDLSLNCEGLWALNPTVCINLLLSLLSPRVASSANAEAKRNVLLNWLPAKIDALANLNGLPLALLHDVAMHCSYATFDQKHTIRGSIARLIRRTLLNPTTGYADLATPIVAPAPGTLPTMLVPVEWFHSKHSIYRTHSLALEALRSHYHLIGFGFEEVTDASTRAMFDEFTSLSYNTPLFDTLAALQTLAKQAKPQVLYYPSIGMFQYTLFASTLRLAPLQIMGTGHPATSGSPVMDQVIVEAECIGDVACYSETVLPVSRQAIPFRPPAVWPQPYPKRPRRRNSVKVGVIGAVMKINAPFLAMCRRILDTCQSDVELEFIPAFAQGVAWLHVREDIVRMLPEAVVHPMMEFSTYLDCIAQLDLFINPYPFGNVNTIVDCVGQGVPGVCRTGREVHSCFDGALFEQLGLGSQWVATSEDDYVAKAVQLIDSASERAALRQHIVESGYAARLFEGEPALFAQAVVQAHQAAAERAGQI
ncbi:MAG: hypothetical protein ACK4FF_09705 [Limnobacter sp.]|uniref:hypothetical protein n=1 Tax=Limnobacter sp. TaxID=2003368 RepID=UPI00391C2073